MKALKLKRKILSLAGKNSNDGKLSFVVSYLHNRKRLPNLRSPKDLSEIWIKRVLDGEVNELYYLADKYAVRQYVEERGLGYILTPLLGVYESADQIDFEVLPNRFALKANFGAGRNVICTDKSKLDLEQTRSQVNEWLRPTIYSYAERHYNLISKKFVCEEFIDDGSGGFPVDYKFMCIHGKVHCILACGGRENGHADYLPYSLSWEPMYDYYRSVNKGVELFPKPLNLSEMVEIAEKLAEGIDLVRIDLYSNGKRIWFGEVTLTPSGCIFHRWSRKAINEMGMVYRKLGKDA